MAEQFAREEAPGVTADDLAKVKSRAEAAEQRATAETEARQKAEAERDALTKERDAANQRIQQEVAARVQADEVAITNAISSAQSARDSAAQRLADALAANDAVAIAKAIDDQSTAKFEMIQAENQNRQLQNWKQQQVARLQAAEEARKRQAEQQPSEEAARRRQEAQTDQRQTQNQQTQTDGKLDVSGLPPGHQEFFRRHPELLDLTPKGNRERNMVIADHWDAVDRGLVEGTPSYYEFIEGALQSRRAPQQEEQHQDVPALEAEGMEISLETPQDSGTRVVRRDAPVRPTGAREHEVTSPQQRQSAAAALPPSRSTTPANGSRDTGRITLSLGEQEAARISFPHLIKGNDASEAYKEYAMNKKALMTEGRL